MVPDPVLSEIERCYDAIPRPQGTAEEVGPFTLFVADPATGWAFYARPTLGASGIGPDDVRRVLARQRELGVPRAIEWVDDVTPSLLPAVRSAVTEPHDLEVLPLLALPSTHVLPPPDPRVRLMTGLEPELGSVLGAVHSGFAETDDDTPLDPATRPVAIDAGWLLVVGAFEDGRAVGGGSAAPRDRAAELMGIATTPRARRRGIGAAVTGALAAACRAAGVSTVYMAAGSDDSLSVYRAVGFERVGTACILGVP